MASYYRLECNLQWWDEPLYPSRRDVLAEICKLLNSDSSSMYGSGWGRLEECGTWEVLGAGEIGFPMADRYRGVVTDIEEELPLKFSLPFASGTLDIGKAIMQARRIRRADADMLPQGWTFAGSLDVAIPAEMDLAWGGNATNEEMASKPLAFYFQGAAEEDLGNRAGCHFTDELEKALEDYYGISRFTLYQGTSECAFSSPAYTWHLTAYYDEFSDMWLALTPFRTARRHLRADNTSDGTIAITVPDVIAEEWSNGGIEYYDTPDQMPLATAIWDYVEDITGANSITMTDVCDVMCGYFGLAPDEFWNGPSNKCFAKMSRRFILTVHGTENVTLTCTL